VAVKNANKIIKILKQLYPAPYCELNYSAPHELLIAARLSAQCTDKRVNATTAALFDRFTKLKAFAEADIAEIEKIIKPCGLYKTKAASIKGMCQILCEEYDGIIPCEMDELLKLPGVGRKTANLILGELYDKPAIVADTHVIRLSGRLGLAKGDDPYKVEKTLKEIIPQSESLHFCHRLVLHGRRVCKARKPDCQVCGLNIECRYFISCRLNPE
jgi:endonuclease-3